LSDRVFFLGAGRAGTGLARALDSAGVEIVGLHGRTGRDGSPPVTAGPLPDELGKATVVLVTVQDAVLDAALRELVASRRLAPGAAVLHASGASDPAALALVRQAGHPSGTFHPLAPLALPDDAAARLRGAWIGVDGDAEAMAISRRLAERLGAHALEIPLGEKARYHAAAVFASNFPVVLASAAVKLLETAGVRHDPAIGAVRTLLFGAAANVAAIEPSEALTGPAVRGDATTVRAHLAALANDSALLDAYVALSKIAIEGRDGEVAKLLDVHR
jgi:predicted short-subunit dehydrogenase-like oxidoreductase (DUF2520 family)